MQIIFSYLTCIQHIHSSGSHVGPHRSPWGGLQGTFQQDEDSFKFTVTSTSQLSEIKYKNDWYAHWTLGSFPFFLTTYYGQLYKLFLTTTNCVESLGQQGGWMSSSLQLNKSLWNPAGLQCSYPTCTNNNKVANNFPTSESPTFPLELVWLLGVHSASFPPAKHTSRHLGTYLLRTSLF